MLAIVYHNHVDAWRVQSVDFILESNLVDHLRDLNDANREIITTARINNPAEMLKLGYAMGSRGDVTNSEIVNERLKPQIQYSNEYGSLTLTKVSELMSIRDISYKTTKEVQDNLISIELSEQVALITSNQKIQIGFTSTMEAYIIYHDSRSTGYICSVELTELNLPDGESADDVLARLNKRIYN